MNFFQGAQNRVFGVGGKKFMLKKLMCFFGPLVNVVFMCLAKVMSGKISSCANSFWGVDKHSPDDGQSTLLICVRLQDLLYDFLWVGGGGGSGFPVFFLPLSFPAVA